MKDFIEVRTPFNVDRFKSLLRDDPNQPFVRSVMTRLREGFWPFYKGKWKELHDDCKDNFLHDQSPVGMILQQDLE